jgi:hypothetical protein
MVADIAKDVNEFIRLRILPMWNVKATWDAMWPSRMWGCPCILRIRCAEWKGGFLRPARTTGTLCARHPVSHPVQR